MNGHFGGGRIRRLVTLSLLACVSLVIFAVEAAVPPIVPIPGVKPGLANVVTLFLILAADKRAAASVLIVRIILSAVFAGQAVSLMYSFAGGLLAFAAMCAVSALLNGKPVWFISAVGGVFHNIGQLCAACVIMSGAVLVYLPHLVISGVVTGVVTGLLTRIIINKLQRSGLLQKFTAALSGEERER